MEKRIESVIWVLIGLVVLVAAVAIVVSILYGGRYVNGTYGPYGMMGAYGFYGVGIIMPIVGAITFIFVLLFIYFFLEGVRGHTMDDTRYNRGSAEDIAKERFAKGEITEAEYQRIIETIRK
ncbi:MAG: SHOCT domain-containing protein [Thermoplasmata archaeon]